MFESVDVLKALGIPERTAQGRKRRKAPDSMSVEYAASEARKYAKLQRIEGQGSSPSTQNVNHEEENDEEENTVEAEAAC